MDRVTAMLEQISLEMQARGGIRSVYFVGCGGSQAALFPGRYFLQSRSQTLITDLYNSNEFVHNPPGALGPSSVVICCSLKATAETVAALQLAAARGAAVIAMTGSAETLMAKSAQNVIIYSFGEDQDYGMSNQAVALRLAVEIHHQVEGYEDYDDAVSAFAQLNGIFRDARKSMEVSSQEFARAFASDEVFYVMGSGPLFYTAYTMACCHLMEMQRKHAVFLHSGEYFHGPFETTAEDTAIILFKSQGRTRPLDERVERFLHRHSNHHIVIDAAECGFDRLSPAVAEYFEPLILIPLERHFVYQMSVFRGHSMDHRRYMWKEDY